MELISRLIPTFRFSPKFKNTTTCSGKSTAARRVFPELRQSLMVVFKRPSVGRNYQMAQALKTSSLPPNPLSQPIFTTKSIHY
ncbi:hypothetical protein [Acidocella sp. KAb 2-4]|uniref:hypothetical protein n=1 Tax=Acidocella sp. KAb 2-4 TaxID=2885158 RepID=UPI001D083DC5|nr:hypothetical protein [Acidocella sp. KAb 2-4]